MCPDLSDCVAARVNIGVGVESPVKCELECMEPFPLFLATMHAETLLVEAVRVFCGEENEGRQCCRANTCVLGNFTVVSSSGEREPRAGGEVEAC